MLMPIILCLRLMRLLVFTTVPANLQFLYCYPSHLSRLRAFENAIAVMFNTSLSFSFALDRGRTIVFGYNDRRISAHMFPEYVCQFTQLQREFHEIPTVLPT